MSEITEHPHAAHAADHDHAHAGHVRTLVTIYLVLMALLGATVGVAFINLGEANIIIAMSIALLKAALVVLIFMHVLQGGKLVWIFAASGFVWLAIMLVLTFNDYLTRGQITRGQRFDESGVSQKDRIERRAPQPEEQGPIEHSPK